MKKCPKCGTQYSDVTLSYCLQDGTPLVPVPGADHPTVVMGETETFVPPRDIIRVPIEGRSSSDTPVTRSASGAQAENKKSNTVLAVALTAIGMLILFSIIGVAAFIFLRNSQQAPAGDHVDKNGGPAINYSSPQSSAASPAPTVVLGTPASTIRPSPAATAGPILSTYPATTRLKFARGAFTTSFSGDVNPGDTRTLVLSCRSGQSLSATITSGAKCVSMRGESTIRMITSGGDNYITVTNDCSTVARFNISITVI